MLNRVCFLTNDNLYNSKRYFTKCLAEAMERLGCEVKIYDVGEKGLQTDDVIKIFDWLPDMTCSFSTISSLPDQKFFWDHLKIPHLFILLDPAVFYMKFIQSPYSIVSCVDRYDCSFFRKAKFESTFFLPHAVEREQLNQPIDGDRPYDVVLVGSCYDHESLRENWKKNLSTDACDVLESAIDIVFEEPETHFTEAIVKSMNLVKGDPKGIDILNLAIYLDHYLRGKDRHELIHSIKDAHVHIFGKLYWDEEGRLKDWNTYFGDQENVTVHEGVPFQDSFEIYRKSKICLNSTPFFKNGSHERVFNSLAMGCSVIASENVYLKEQFSPAEGVSFYSFTNREAVDDVIYDWLDNEKERMEAVLKGRELIKNHHTWDHRAWQIMDEIPKLMRKIQVMTD